MSGRVAHRDRDLASFESATRVAVVAALSATCMLFASVGSAYLVRRSFGDWAQPAFVLWPGVLLAFAFVTSIGIEAGSRTLGRSQRRAFRAAAVASGLYLLSALGVIVSIAFEGRLTAPHSAFVVLLLSVHIGHSILGVAFAGWILRESVDVAVANSMHLVRLVTHFLTAILLAIVLLLFARL